MIIKFRLPVGGVKRYWRDPSVLDRNPLRAGTVAVAISLVNSSWWGSGQTPRSGKISPWAEYTTGASLFLSAHTRCRRGGAGCPRFVPRIINRLSALPPAWSDPNSRNFGQPIDAGPSPVLFQTIHRQTAMTGTGFRVPAMAQRTGRTLQGRSSPHGSDTLEPGRGTAGLA